jgi:hypothetical protein
MTACRSLAAVTVTVNVTVSPRRTGEVMPRSVVQPLSIRGAADAVGGAIRPSPLANVAASRSVPHRLRARRGGREQVVVVMGGVLLSR